VTADPQRAEEWERCAAAAPSATAQREAGRSFYF
jgi:hypothetical protein